MKIHTKKKAYRAMLKQAAKEGYANKANGQLVQRSQLTDNSMRRDYYPQGS